MQLEGTPNEDGLGAPLKVDHKIIGVIFLQSYVKGIHYTAQDDEILASVAKYIATALTRFRALEAERERTTELAIINIVQSGLAAGLELQAIIDLVGDTLREALVSSNIVINLYDEKTNLLSYLYAYEQGAPLTIAPQPPHPDGVFEKLIKTHDTIFLRYGGKLGESASALPGSVACKSGLAVPIVINDSIQGAVHVEDFKREYVYGESELRLLTTVAASLGAALENIRLSNQRNEAIEALRQSEEKFRRIVSSLPQFISIWDMNMECNYVSPSVYNLTGYTPDERLALRKEEYIPPESIPTFDKILKEELAREHSPDWDPNKVITFDLEEIRKDGSRLILESTFTFLRDATGAPVAILSISADITEQKRAEIELRESEEKLRSIFENAFDGICIYEEFPDEDRRVLLECNERYCQMAGRSKEELLAVEDTRTFQHIIENAPEEQDWESVKAGKAFSGIFSWIRPDGKENIIEYNAAPTKLGDRYFTIGMDRDITERWQAEQALRESEEKLHLIFENAFDGISIYEEIPSQDKRILLECNERYCQMAGRSKEELLAVEDTRVIQRDLGIDAERFLWERIIAGKAFPGVFTWIRPDGKENVIEYNAAPTRVGDRYFTIGLDRDVTERKQNEQRLRESEQRLMDIINFLPIATMVTDQDGRVTAWNQAMEEITGVMSEDIVGRGNYEYALPFYSKRLPILIDLVNLPEDELDARYSYVRRRGGILTAESVCDLLGKKERLLVGFASALSSSDGQIRGAIESIEDVTDQRQTEIELKKAKEAAESANRSKSVFLANMSHEIRTPMNAILGFTQLMQRDSDLSSRQREHLDIINRSGEHLLALINDILELSKIEAGRATFMPVNFDLHKLLADLEVMFRVRTDEKKLRLLLEMADDVPQWMIADEGKLRQVLINLIGNAVKFTEEGGIGIRVGIQSDQTQKKSLLIEVEDTGPGILPEEVEKLFKPFEQASSGIKMGGTGLGLALSQGFVQIMGGTITISSIIGQGSTFRFSIPFDEGKEDSSKHKETKERVVGLKPGQGDIRVLIADDRETNRQILTQMLSSVGFKIHEVTNGIEVIEEFHTWNPQIILMDMRMPVMDGYEATRKIKEDVEGKKTMIIAVTASAFQEDRQRIMAAGADGYISKPFKETDLFETIRRLTHVIYLYESDAVEEQATVSDDDLIWQKAVAALPADLVGECREVAENADIFRLLELITDLSKINVKIGRRLNDLAQRYAYEEIVNLLTVGE